LIVAHEIRSLDTVDAVDRFRQNFYAWPNT
jgi:hypothetical protein